jgi:hypothetical protein
MDAASGVQPLAGLGASLDGALDLGLGARIIRQEALKIRGRQFERPAIAERDDVGLAATPPEERHLADKLPAAEAHPKASSTV